MGLRPQKPQYIHVIKLGEKRREKVCVWAQDQIQAFQAWEEVSSGIPALHAGLFIFDPFGIGAKAPKTSIFDASRLKALNMNSPRQSLGMRMQKNKPGGLES
jgi:hypothetical protein